MRKRILNAFNGKVAFIAEIEDISEESEQKGSSVLWAKENGESVAGCDLSGMRISDQDLTGTSFKGCDLTSAIFHNCNLSDCDFTASNCVNTIFTYGNLTNCKLTKSELQHAQFAECTFDETDFSGCHIQRTNFDGSDINKAKFFQAHGVNDYVRCMQIEEYHIVWTYRDMYIGCNMATIEQVAAMGPEMGTHYGGEVGLKYWTKSKDMVMKIVRDRPALQPKSPQPRIPKRVI